MIVTRSCLRTLPCLLLVVLVSEAVAVGARRGLCDVDLSPIAGKVGYRWRGYGCEGLYIAPVAARSLEVVSSSVGKFDFDLQPNLRLEVSAPQVADLVRGPVRVRAVALPLKTYYRMDAELPSHGRMVWSGNEVLLPQRLSASLIGVFGWVAGETENTFVPLRVVQQGRPQALGAVELVVRSPVEVETLKWRSSIEGERLPSPPPWLDAISVPIPAGRPVRIVLPKGNPAAMRLELAAKERNSDHWSTLRIRVIRPALP